MSGGVHEKSETQPVRPVRSMTGFGRALATDPSGWRVVVQIRSVNHKGLKIAHRLPEALSALRHRIDAWIKERLERGSVQIEIEYKSVPQAVHYVVHREVLKHYVEALSEVQAELGREASAIAIDRLAMLPGVIDPVEPEGAEEPEALEVRIEPVVREALAALLVSRETEGRVLAHALRAMTVRIEGWLAEIRSALPSALAAANERLRRRVEALLGDAEIDPGVLAREVAIAADKADVSEEFTRLEAHIGAVRAALERGGPCGRRLEFLAQELQREASTLAAKLQDPSLIQTALEIKLEVGRMREQVANVE